MENRNSWTTLEGGVPCAAPRSHYTLKAGEKNGFTFIPGFASTMEEADTLHHYFFNADMIAVELEKVKENWKKYCTQYSVICPDKEVSSIVSIWNPYQCKATFDWYYLRQMNRIHIIL
ncbi:MAG: hypothetical protein JXB88_13605 [Spirochaetales bacterium]|nr:hypothetical protein [Spirochaetales bacterium]